jgi:hypothetical protein
LEILRAVISENLRHQRILGKNHKVRNNMLPSTEVVTVPA